VAFEILKRRAKPEPLTHKASGDLPAVQASMEPAEAVISARPFAR
jgi:hypothetical protein